MMIRQYAYGVNSPKKPASSSSKRDEIVATSAFKRLEKTRELFSARSSYPDRPKSAFEKSNSWSEQWMSTSTLYSSDSGHSEARVVARDFEIPISRTFRTTAGILEHHSFQKKGNNSEIVLATEKLDLSKKSLTECPNLQEVTQLRCLDLQNNVITKIDHLHTLYNLMYLDLYNNQLTTLHGVAELVNLRGLMLGRNKITKIEGLSTLTRLDTLDLHSNRIEVIENLRSLLHLRSLNLEDNLVREIPTLYGMVSLQELNLRRNKVWAIHDNGHLKKLTRLLLSDNNIQNIQDMEAVFELENLQELAIDQNKVSDSSILKTLVVSKCKYLKLLNGRRVLEETKRSAIKMAKKEEMKRKDMERKADYLQEKERYIEQIRTHWNADSGTDDAKAHTNGKTAYVELDGSTLRVFGNGVAALNRSESQDCVSIQFEYICLPLVVPYFDTMALFKSLTHLYFGNTQFSRLKEVSEIGSR
ncbi:hypothetical protein HDV03_000653 [Kappamyces sp. JEL0829]|nr:hypothetical protein HDV03_000653 [Kappamyces sp. JEL0829]